MIDDWIAQTPALIAVLGVLYGPGAAIVWVLRIRGLALWALAPVASTVVAAILAVGLGVLGIAWSVGSAIVGFILVFAVAALAGFALGARSRNAQRDGRALGLVAAGIAVGALLSAVRLGAYIGDPDAISQTNDAVFHLNAVRFAIDTGSASSWGITGVLGGSSFYPSAWHAMTSLVVLLSGASIPVAANMMSLVIAALIWPVSITWMTLVLSRSASPAAVAGALSPALLAYPMLMLEWGVLYPYALAIALLPSVVAVTIAAPDWIGGAGPVVGPVRNAILAALAALAGVGALALAQPSVILAWSLLTVVWFSWWGGHRLRRGSSHARSLIPALVVAWVAFAAVWLALSFGTGGSRWEPFSGEVTALLAVLLNAPVVLPFAFGVSLLMFAGLIVAIRRPPLRWLATSWLVFAGLYIVAAAIGQPVLRRLLVGAWYADPYRLAALLPVTVVPLAAIGLAVIALRAGRALSSRHADGSITARATAWAIAAIALVGAAAIIAAPIVQMPRITETQPDSESRYAADDRSFLSPDERALLGRLDETVADGQRVIGNPSTGMGFGFMLSGVDVYPRTWTAPATAEWAVLADRLRDAADDAGVCDALAAIGADYVLDFGPGEDGTGRRSMPGMTDFEDVPGFELVDHEGAASLWRITACAR